MRRPNAADPLASLVVGEHPAHPDPIPFPMILGHDGAGTFEDGTPVAIDPVMGRENWRDDETLDPHWHIFSEKVAGTFAGARSTQETLLQTRDGPEVLGYVIVRH